MQISMGFTGMKSLEVERTETRSHHLTIEKKEWIVGPEQEHPTGNQEVSLGLDTINKHQLT